MPSPSPLSRCQAGYMLLHMEISKRFNEPMGLVYVLAAALTAFLSISLYWHSAGPVEVCSLPVLLVSPGDYAPLECAEWHFYRGAESEFMRALEFRMAELSSELEVSPLTSAHVRYNFCGMVHNGTMLLNPAMKLLGSSRQPQLVSSRLLCGEVKPSLTVNFADKIELEWRDTAGKRHSAKFEGEEAADLQICMSILQGQPICGLPAKL
jgi:hypothetical protein